jgi:hypothetical protein
MYNDRKNRTAVLVPDAPSWFEKFVDKLITIMIYVMVIVGFVGVVVGCSLLW